MLLAHSGGRGWAQAEGMPRSALRGAQSAWMLPWREDATLAAKGPGTATRLGGATKGKTYNQTHTQVGGCGGKQCPGVRCFGVPLRILSAAAHT